MDTRELIRRVNRPLGGIELAELQALRSRLEEARSGNKTRLDEVEHHKNALFADGVNHADQRGQRARAQQIQALDAEADQVAALLRIAHKQCLLLDRLIWLRENLAALERLRTASAAAVPVDWPGLLDSTSDITDEETRLDELNSELQSAEGGAQREGVPMLMAAGNQLSGVTDPPSSATPPTLPLVVRVFDGATIELADGRKVRYIGVDSPQLRNALGRPDAGAWEARDANRALVGHKRVRLEADALDSDADDVLWRYVYVGDTLVNAELLRQGAALCINRYPNTCLAAELLAAEQDARRGKRGLWKET